VHPDKPAELWINEVGVAPSHQRRGIGRALLRAVFARGRALGCREAWVLTSPANGPAIRMYESVGGRDLADPPVMFTFRLDAEAAEP
jgi:aminoglycoside 6'-N-acetyltransferase I